MGAFDTMPAEQSDPQQDRQRFLEAVFGAKQQDEHVFIWLLAGKKKISASFRSLAEVEAYVAPNFGKYNIYYGVATCDTSLVNLSRVKIEQLDPSQVRYLEEDVTALYGLWADIDYDGGIQDARVHKKAGLPPTREDALSVVYGLEEMPPSIVVCSGHGLQALWLFDEPLTLRTKAEREEAHDMTRAWHAVMQSIAARLAVEQGQAPWMLDSTHDLARVMRLPGTTNIKRPEHPVLSTVDVIHPERRYTLDAVRQVLGQRHTRSTFQAISGGMKLEDVIAEDFTIPAQAQLPARWSELLEVSPYVDATLRHKGLSSKDDSLSAVDMRLAIAAAEVEWTTQEMVDLIAYHRQSYHEAHPETRTKESMQKMFRPDYYARTIAAARNFTASAVERANELAKAADSASEYQRTRVNSRPRTPIIVDAEPVSEPVSETAVEQKLPKVRPAVDPMDWLGGDDSQDDGAGELVTPDGVAGQDYVTPADQDATRSEALKMLTQHIFGDNENILIIDVARMVAAQPIFRMVITVNGETVNINLGSVSVILDPNKFASAVAGHTKYIPKMYKRDTWHKIAQNLLLWTTDLDIGEEATETGLVTQWLNSYLDSSSLVDLDDEDDEIAERMLSNNAHPVIKDGNVHIFGGHFGKWLQTQEMERLSHATMGNYLRTYGCISTSVKITRNGRKTTVSAWRIPLEVASPFIERLRSRS